jgi:hypothetical protein
MVEISVVKNLILSFLMIKVLKGALCYSQLCYVVEMDCAELLNEASGHGVAGFSNLNLLFLIPFTSW